MAKDTVTIAYYKQSVLVTGKTIPIKETLKSIGGKWNGPLKGWVFRKRNRDQVVTRLRGMSDVNVTDRTSAAAGGSSGAAAVESSPARSARKAKPATEDYSDLASLPRPNRDKFGADLVQGELPPNWPRGIPVEHFIEHMLGGRTLGYASHDIAFYEVQSRREREEQRHKEELRDLEVPAGCYIPKISVEGSRCMKKTLKSKKSFSCDGTMFRHTSVSWKDAPVLFQYPHEVEGKEIISYEHKIEDLTPFDCDVYWKTIWEKCPSCHDADREFERWAVRAATPGGKAAIKRSVIVSPEKSKKRKADDENESNGPGSSKVPKGNLKSEE